MQGGRKRGREASQQPRDLQREGGRSRHTQAEVQRGRAGRSRTGAGRAWSGSAAWLLTLPWCCGCCLQDGWCDGLQPAAGCALPPPPAHTCIIGGRPLIQPGRHLPAAAHQPTAGGDTARCSAAEGELGSVGSSLHVLMGWEVLFDNRQGTRDRPQHNVSVKKPTPLTANVIPVNRLCLLVPL